VGRRPVELSKAKIAACLLAAMRRLRDREGKVLIGPTEAGREAASDYGKPIPSTLASLYLRRLADADEVERIAQGPRRGRYRLVEKFGDD
jgi:hypothetical protein